MHFIVYILGGLFTHRAFVQISERRPLWTDRPAPGVLAEGGWIPAPLAVRSWCPGEGQLHAAALS